MHDIEGQINGCKYRLSAAQAKIRKLNKQTEAEKENIRFWREKLKEREDNLPRHWV